MILVPGSNSSASGSMASTSALVNLDFSASMGTLMHRLTFGGPIARARWVVGPGYLYPFDSQYYAQHDCQNPFALILLMEKGIPHPKVVRGVSIWCSGVEEASVAELEEASDAYCSIV